MSEIHPLVAEFGGGGPETAAHVSAWIRSVEGDGSRVVVLPPIPDTLDVDLWEKFMNRLRDLAGQKPLNPWPPESTFNSDDTTIKGSDGEWHKVPEAVFVQFMVLTGFAGINGDRMAMLARAEAE